MTHLQCQIFVFGLTICSGGATGCAGDSP